MPIRTALPSFLRRTLLHLLFAGALLLVGCSGENAEDRGWEHLGNVLHMSVGTEPQDLDPHLVTGIPEFNILISLFEGLVTYHPETLEPEPGVAKSWEVEGNEVFTFRLREDAKWSNGDPVTAHDFVYSTERILAPAYPGPMAFMQYQLKNGKAYKDKEVTDFSEVGIKALDDHTLRLTLENPNPYFIFKLPHYSFYPVHKESVESFGPKTETGTGWTKAGNLICNGPFTLVKWVQNSHIRVEPNPHYWDAEKVELDAVVFHPIDNTSTEERSFRDRQLHVTSGLPISSINAYQETPYFYESPYVGLYYYSMNVERPPLDDPRVRKALSMSLDRKSLIRSVVKGDREPAYSVIPPVVPRFESPVTLEENLEEAKRLLAEAGYPNGEGFPEVELLYNTSENHKFIAEVIQAMWKERLGIDIGLQNQEWKVYLSSRTKGDFQMARAGWIGDPHDPASFLAFLYSSDSENNDSNFSNPEYDAIIERSERSGDIDTRIDELQKAERILMEEMPLIPLYFYTRIRLMSPDVQGWHKNLLDLHPYKYVTLKTATGSGGAEPQ